MFLKRNLAKEIKAKINSALEQLTFLFISLSHATHNNSLKDLHLNLLKKHLLLVLI